MLTLKGTSDYLGTEYANKLVIKTDKVYTSHHTVDGIEKISMNINTNAPVYSTGIDRSGGTYEHITIRSGNWYYSIANLTMNEYTQEEFTIRTWDRKTIFVSLRYKHKGHGRGKHWYPDTSDVEGCIIELDNQSAILLSEYIDSIKTKNS